LRDGRQTMGGECIETNQRSSDERDQHSIITRHVT